jgi:hypothetical protein
MEFRHGTDPWRLKCCSTGLLADPEEVLTTAATVIVRFTYPLVSGMQEFTISRGSRREHFDRKFMARIVRRYLTEIYYSDTDVVESNPRDLFLDRVEHLGAAWPPGSGERYNVVLVNVHDVPGAKLNKTRSKGHRVPLDDPAMVAYRALSREDKAVTPAPRWTEEQYLAWRKNQ